MGVSTKSNRLYREFLKEKEGTVTRPYLKELIAGVPPEGDDSDPEIWKRELLSLQERIAVGAAKLNAASGKGVIFCKHMSKHSLLYDFDDECQVVECDEGTTIRLAHRHVLLIRDPVAVLSAWGAVGDVHGNDPTPEELGFISMMTIYSKLESTTMSGDVESRILVLDSDELAKNPKQSLSDLCECLSIEYSDNMLSWEEGEHKCDGPWAKVSLSILVLASILRYESWFGFLILPFIHSILLISGGTIAFTSRTVGIHPLQ